MTKNPEKQADAPQGPPREDPCALCGQRLGDPGEIVAAEGQDLQVRWMHKDCVPTAPLRARLKSQGGFPPEYVGRPGQKPPRRFTALSWAVALWPGFVVRFDREVPEEMWSAEGLGDELEGTIACPCGHEPRVKQNHTAICPGENCGRAFMLIGDTIRVARFEPEELAQAQL